jgi:hypothetical protein
VSIHETGMDTCLCMSKKLTHASMWTYKWIYICEIFTPKIMRKYYVFRHYPSSCLCLECRPVSLSKHNVSETGFCLRLQVKTTQLGPIDRANPYLCVTSAHPRQSVTSVFTPSPYVRAPLPLPFPPSPFSCPNRLTTGLPEKLGLVFLTTQTNRLVLLSASH